MMRRSGNGIMAAVLLAVGMGVVLACAACQETPAGGTPATDQTVTAASVPPKGAAGTVTWYTHDGAEMLYRQAKYADAESMCKQAVTQIEKSTGGKASKSPELAPPLIDLATIYMRLARYDEAKQVLDRAESVLDKSKPDQALLLGRLGINKGWRLYTMGQTEQATKVFEDARILVENNQKGDSIDLAELINNQGLMYEEIGEKQEDADMVSRARRLLLQGWIMRRKLTGDNSPETAESLNNLGMHLTFNGDTPEEIELGMDTLQKALEVSVKAYGANHPETAMAHAVLGMVLFMRREPDDAEKEIRIAMPITENFLGDMHPDRAFELMTLGRIQQSRSKYDAAEKSFTEALAIDEHTYGKTHPNLVGTLEALKGLYDAEGESVKAIEVEKRIEKLSGKDL